MARRQRDELIAPADEEWIGADDRARRLAARTRLRRPHRIRASVLALQDIESAARGRGPPPARLAYCASAVRIGRVDEQRDCSRLWAPARAAAPAASPLARAVKKLTPVTLPPGRLRLATRPSFDRVAAAVEDDRNRRGRRLGRECRRGRRRSRQSPLPGGEPDRPPVPAVDRIGPPPSDIRSPRSGPRHSRLPSSPGGTPAR